MKLKKLNKQLFQGNYEFPEGLAVGPLHDYPEKVLQFGEGNFMRAFVDWMVNEANRQGLFAGRVVVVQPLSNGLIPQINSQDGMYTLYLRGMQNGVLKEEKNLITAISRGIDPYREWADLLACAENPALRFIFSNTTEAGIAYSPEPYTGSVQQSYPAKLTAVLYHRFKSLAGDPGRGIILIPCELIDRNGDELKRIVLKYGDDWALPGEFAHWLNEHCYFLNSLVDRIVPGYPRETAPAIWAELGYEDKLLDTGEIFHLWVIEGPAHLAEELPLHKAGLNVLWVPDMTPYRTRKVRILNGAHTMTVSVAYLSGLDTVREAVEHELIGAFLQRGLYEEIVPTLELPCEEVLAFAKEVMERFQNPHIRHFLLDISLNSSSKFKTRVLPSLLRYAEQERRLPGVLTFSLAALCVFYRGVYSDGRALVARREQGQYTVQDDADALRFFCEVWAGCDGFPADCLTLAGCVLGRKSLWGADLNGVAGLREQLAANIHSILFKGMAGAVRDLLQNGEEKQ